MPTVSKKRYLFSVYGVTLYNPSTGDSYGSVKAVGEAALTLSQDEVALHAGPIPFPLAVELGKGKSEFALKLKEFPIMLWQLFQGKLPSVTSADAGSVNNVTPVVGTSVIQAVTGIASVGVIPTTGAANLKFGRYLLKAASATTFNLYSMSDANFGRGTSASILDDYGLVTASALTVTTGGAFTDIVALGLRITGGSGTIAMVIGDSIIFDVMPPSNTFTDVKVGGQNDQYPLFGAIVMAKPINYGKQLCMLDIYGLKSATFPQPFNENAWATTEIKATAIYDSVKDGIYRHYWIDLP